MEAPINWLRRQAGLAPRCIESGAVRLPVALPRSERLAEWLRRGCAASMGWMEETAETRKHPASFNGCSYSVAWLSLWQYPRPLQKQSEPIAAFAHGEDYHIEIGRLLIKWAAHVSGLSFIDKMPVAERELAAMAGLGFIGRNGMLISQKHGSAFFIGGILLRMEASEAAKYETKANYQKLDSHKYCGKCRKCIEACPGQALSEDGYLDSRKCASYLTIEHKDPFTEEQKQAAKNSIFGCDICQRICPYNAMHLKKTAPYFSPEEREWKKSAIKKTPLHRAGQKKLFRNQENYIALRQASVCLPPAF